jgi:hypothetical protein
MQHNNMTNTEVGDAGLDFPFNVPPICPLSSPQSIMTQASLVLLIIFSRSVSLCRVDLLRTSIVNPQPGTEWQKVRLIDWPEMFVQTQRNLRFTVTLDLHSLPSP